LQLATTVLQLHAGDVNFLRIKMKQVVLSGEVDQLFLKVFVRQQHSSLLAHEYGSRDRSALLVDHRVGHRQGAAPIHPHDAVNQSAAAGLACLLDHIECYVKVL